MMNSLADMLIQMNAKSPQVNRRGTDRARPILAALQMGPKTLTELTALFPADPPARVRSSVRKMTERHVIRYVGNRRRGKYCLSDQPRQLAD